MVWHGGLSGSAPIKVAEAGHLADLAAIAGIDPALLPATLPLGLTVFSTQNLLTTAALIAAVAGTAVFLGRRLDRQPTTGPALPPPVAPATRERIAPLLRVLPALFGTILLASPRSLPPPIRMRPASASSIPTGPTRPCSASPSSSTAA